uniref:lysozyme n=1 Tax=Hemiscolopendra marginata TaxID=943146 RepID=A0A646QEA4_9MYRI
MKTLFYFFVFHLMVITVFGVQFSRCALANIMSIYKVRQDHIHDWACIAEVETDRETFIMRTNEETGQTSYGMFQINSTYCSTPTKAATGPDCGVPCFNLLNYNIKDDLECAEQVYKSKGFYSWPSWKQKCRGRTDITQGC